MARKVSRRSSSHRVNATALTAAIVPAQHSNKFPPAARKRSPEGKRQSEWWVGSSPHSSRRAFAANSAQAAALHYLWKGYAQAYVFRAPEGGKYEAYDLGLPVSPGKALRVIRKIGDSEHPPAQISSRRRRSSSSRRRKVKSAPVKRKSRSRKSSSSGSRRRRRGPDGRFLPSSSSRRRRSVTALSGLVAPPTFV